MLNTHWRPALPRPVVGGTVVGVGGGLLSPSAFAPASSPPFPRSAGSPALRLRESLASGSKWGRCLISWKTPTSRLEKATWPPSVQLWAPALASATVCEASALIRAAQPAPSFSEVRGEMTLSFCLHTSSANACSITENLCSRNASCHLFHSLASSLSDDESGWSEPSKSLCEKHWKKVSTYSRPQRRATRASGVYRSRSNRAALAAATPAKSIREIPERSRLSNCSRSAPWNLDPSPKPPFITASDCNAEYRCRPASGCAASLCSSPEALSVRHVRCSSGASKFSW
mmetsp:Transcript_1056/g.2062  ORF Transcript_1056/g.2062 Transcript_1056/m.2062 type:complete len:287 (+) Transcript_1056:627-1487(+)